jgi:hypothetical protein
MVYSTRICIRIRHSGTGYRRYASPFTSSSSEFPSLTQESAIPLNHSHSIVAGGLLPQCQHLETAFRTIGLKLEEILVDIVKFLHKLSANEASMAWIWTPVPLCHPYTTRLTAQPRKEMQRQGKAVVPAGNHNQWPPTEFNC